MHKYLYESGLADVDGSIVNESRDPVVVINKVFKALVWAVDNIDGNGLPTEQSAKKFGLSSSESDTMHELLDVFEKHFKWDRPHPEEE